MGMIETEHEVVTVPSRDGTAIACHRSGTGPPLVLVHAVSPSPRDSLHKNPRHLALVKAGEAVEHVA